MKDLAFSGLNMWLLQVTSLNFQIILAVFPIWPEFSVTCRPYRWELAVSFKAKRKVGLHAGSCYGERRALHFFFLPQNFWREPKSVADGRRMRLRDNLGRAWKASQEAASLKCWAGPQWIKREAASSICSSLPCLITTRHSYTHCHCHWTEFRILWKEITNFEGKCVWNCV